MAALCGCSAPAGTATENVVEYSISYEMDGGVNNTKNPVKYTAADLPIAIKSPIKQGFVFEGWTSAALGIGSKTRNVTIPVGAESDITLTAVWRDDRQNSTEAPTVPVEAPKVYDFAEFNGDSFPRGTWTANQLIGKYGASKELKIHYIREYHIASVIMKFEDIDVWSAITNPDLFSFYNDSSETGDYPMTEKDKAVRFEIQDLDVYDPDAKLPHDIKIGQSTKVQIMDVYQEENPYTYIDKEMGQNMIAYEYAFWDENSNTFEGNSAGDVTYSFDENEVLSHVEIRWLPTAE